MKNHLPTSAPGRRPRRAGFTLVEFIGVIAIIAILVTFSLTAVHRQMIETRRDAEDISLSGLAGGLSNVVRFNLTVPSSSTWVAAVAGQLNRNQNEIGTNSMGNTRVVMIDPTFSIGAPSNPFSSLPYSQSIAGSRQVQNLNFIILSSLADPLPSLTGIAYTNVWNSADNALPTGWPTSWKGKPEDLRRERITLGGMFYRLVLNNLDLTNSAIWSMDGSTTNTTLAAGARKEVWVIDGTTLNLCDSTSVLSARDILHADASYIFMNNRWVQSIVPVASVGTGSAAALVTTVDSFLTAVNNTAAPSAGTEGNDDDNDGWDDADDNFDGVKDDDSSGCHGNDYSRNHGNRCNRGWSHGNYGGNNGHGNNIDGVDSSNPGRGHGGPNGEFDPSGIYDDEVRRNPTCNPRTVVDSCFNFMRAYTSWSKNSGCSKNGQAVHHYNEIVSQRERVKSTSNSCP